MATSLAIEQSRHFVSLAERDIRLVEESFARIDSPADAVADFYDELLRSHPHLRRVFLRDDREQRAFIASFMGFVVTNLRSPALVELLERMGAKGLLRGVTSDEIDGIGRAILRTVHPHDCSGFTVETGHAWALAFRWTIGAIRRGARSHSGEILKLTV